MPNNEDTLSICVAENIRLTDVPPGVPLTKEQIEEKLPQEELEKRQKAIAEYMRLMGRYCPPHNIKSKWVEASDVPRVIADGRDLIMMCHYPRQEYVGTTLALAHSQIEEKEPLRFFVLPEGAVIINPLIISNTKAIVYRREGCLSYPLEASLEAVPRYNKITVIYQTLVIKKGNSEPTLSAPITKTLNGKPANVFQHEICHCNGSNIYDTDFVAEKCLGLGEDIIQEKEAREMYEYEYH